jgi:integrase
LPCPAGTAAPPAKSRTAPGTIGALCTEYLRSRDFRALADSTQAYTRRIVAKIADERGRGMLADLRADHLRRDIRPMTPGAARNRLKAWRRILRYAVDDGHLAADPSVGVRPPRAETVPHRQWTVAEIEAFRAYWHTGTPQRLAFEVLFWTGARCVDAGRLGWQMVGPEGFLSYTQAKTHSPATCPIRALPRWATDLARDHAALLAELPSDGMIWIMTAYGRPRTVKGLSQWVSAAASQAGLPDDCTAHGLRKARASALAQIGASPSRIGAWTGHTSLSEVAHYTRQIDQVSLLMGEDRERGMGNAVANFPKLPRK